MSRLTRLLLAAAAIVLIVPASGCASLLSDQATTKHYSGGDGIAVDLGVVQLRGTMLIGSEADAPAQLLTLAINQGDTAQTVEIQIGSESVSIDVPAGQPTKIDPLDGKSVVIPSVDTAPGGLADATFTLDNASKQTQVPVYGKDLPQYAPYLPKPTPTDTPTEGKVKATDSPSDDPTSTPTS